MITIQNNIFLLKRFKDDFVLYNRTINLTTYTLSSIDCTGIAKTIVTATLVGINDVDYITKGNIVLPILTDGNYRVFMGGVNVYFSSWKNYRTRLIPLIEKTLCSKCNDCGNCNDSDENCISKEAKVCLRNQSLFNYIQVYNNLIKPFTFNAPTKFNTFLDNFNSEAIYNNICFIKEELCKQLLETDIDGKTHTNQDLFNYFISIYYLGLYLYDKSFIPTSIFTNDEVIEELEYLKTIYKYDTIKKCILNLGINVDSLIEIITSTENLEVYYWQDNNIENTITEIYPLITQAYLNGKSVKPFNEFNQGVSIVLSNIGRIAFVIKATPLTNFIIEDSLGNNITHEFDVDYVTLLSAAVFVTKEYHSYGTVNFKFKIL
jgi:hypothetical protein